MSIVWAHYSALQTNPFFLAFAPLGLIVVRVGQYTGVSISIMFAVAYLHINCEWKHIEHNRQRDTCPRIAVRRTKLSQFSLELLTGWMEIYKKKTSFTIVLTS